MMDIVRYHALKGCYKLCRTLRLMPKHEYRDRKHLLRLKYMRDRPSRQAMVGDRRDWWMQRFDPYLTENADALPGKYLRLINGLDEDSQRVVQLMVSRLMKMYLNSWRKTRFEPTAREAEMQANIRDELHARLIRFPDGTWAHDRWLMKFRDMEGPFHCRMFMEEIADLKTIRGRDVLDVGGYVGDTALAFQDYTDRKVYAFELNPANIEKMQETVRLNNSTKIVPVPLGLGDREERLFIRKGQVSQGEPFTDSGAPVEITTLDEWAKRNDVDVGLIKVDIEGFEQKFLRGAIETIKKHRPAMLLSIYHTASDLFDIKPFIEDLGLGYRFKVRYPPHTNIMGDTTLICEAHDDAQSTLPRD